MTRQLASRFGLAALAALAACSSAGGSGDDDDGPGPDAALPACKATGAGGFAYEKVATWMDDTKAAYTMIHDDMCGASVSGIQTNAVPALERAGLNAGLAPIAGECIDNDSWDVVLDAERKGNEIVSHSYSHVEITPANAAHEVTEAKAVFDAKLAHPITFFVFPYDYFTRDTINAVGAAGHLGARAGNRDDNDGFGMPPISPATPTNDLGVEFDVWPRNYSKYALYFPEEMLTVHAYNAIEKGGWAMREFHSVVPDAPTTADQGFGPIKLSEYERHLKFLSDAWKKGELWTANPTTVLRYRHAHTACTATVANDTITFDTSNPECVKYATPISVIVTTGDDLPRVDGQQGGASVVTRKLGPKRYSVTADPTKGPVALSGCSNEGYEVFPTIPLPAKPTPAASVCLIESVAGTGSPGRMENFERPAAELQLLPNPAQQDGRTGSWSWYPQNAMVVPQAGVLRYSGTALAKWSGATLAFLGGNGAGACYDGGRYQGIRFKIRGSVTATDELNGKVVVSIVTSETQSRLYGGDLNGEGGHFNKVISITPTWQTVSIPWADLNRPTWGATMSLTAVAKTKLQAIDWGVTIAASSFEIFLDDIEMY